MDNPYRSPDVEDALPAVASPWVRRIHAAVSILIGVFCAAQFVAVWLIFLDLLVQGGAGNVLDWRLAGKMVLPFSLALAGIFLAFGRRVSAIFFAAYLVHYLILYGRSAHFSIASATLAFAFLAYALYRWKAGQLSGWPGKP